MKNKGIATVLVPILMACGGEAANIEVATEDSDDNDEVLGTAMLVGPSGQARRPHPIERRDVDPWIPQGFVSRLPNTDGSVLSKFHIIFHSDPVDAIGRAQPGGVRSESDAELDPPGDDPVKPILDFLKSRLTSPIEIERSTSQLSIRKAVMKEVEAAFGCSFVEYRNRNTGVTARRTARAVLIPSELKRFVKAIHVADPVFIEGAPVRSWHDPL